MNITKNTLQTSRAFIRYAQIQHISWEMLTNPQETISSTEEVSIKIYSAGESCIIEKCSLKEFTSFLNSYKEWRGE